MGKISVAVGILLLLALPPAGSAAFSALSRAVSPAPEAPQVPGTPDTSGRAGAAKMAEAFFEERGDDPSEYPARLVIPSIRLDSDVIGVGVTADGAMDVPDGRTSNVGWYRYGTIPGNLGSAVMDAHVYAAFAKLRYAKIGDDIYVEDASGETRHFRITDSRVYALDEVPLQRIFNADDGRHLALITCARAYVPSLGTYSHRLVVYADLVD